MHMGYEAENQHAEKSGLFTAAYPGIKGGEILFHGRSAFLSQAQESNMMTVFNKYHSNPENDLCQSRGGTVARFIERGNARKIIQGAIF